MSWRNIKLTFCREVRDQLRDRRTLFMIAVLPLLLYPALGIGFAQMKLLLHEQPQTVVILGQKNLPREPKLNLESDKLKVVGDAPPPNGDPVETDPSHAELLRQAEQIRTKLVELQQVEADVQEVQPSGNASGAAEPAGKADRIRDELGEIFASGNMQVLIIVPDGFRDHIEKVNQQFLDRTADFRRLTDYPRPKIVQNSADQKSAIAYDRVQQAMTRWEQSLREQRLKMADLPQTWPDPVSPQGVDLAGREQQSANLWSVLLPALLVIMSVTGAFYPAVDVVAGEKERGTMETLLICPATRTEIVLGKFFTVMLFSMSTALLNLMSMGLTGHYIFSMSAQAGVAKFSSLSPPTLPAIIWVFLLLIPLAALFSALSLALATFARSSKEGQYYLTPLLMITMGLTVFCLFPTVEIEPFYSVMPVLGATLLLKQCIAEPTSTESLVYAIPVLITSVGYSLLALWWAIEQFNREEVLFREAERFELRCWIRHLLRDKEPTPSFTEAGFCFVLIMFLQFASLKFMQQALAAAAPTTEDTIMMRLLMVQQLVIIATPALLMGIMLTASVVRTFQLRLPQWRMLAVAALLPFAMHPLSLELGASLQWFFPPLPQSVADVLNTMTNTRHPWWFVLLTFAAAPALCEEIAFRGFILSGFQRTGRVWLAVGLSSLTFGIMHMIPQQVFNATLLGLVLGLIAIRSKSLLPCILFHFVYNSLEVMRGRIATSGLKGVQVERFVTVGEGGIRYQWPTLLIAGVVAVVLLRWLVNQSDAEPSTTADRLPAVDPGRIAEGSMAGKPPVRVP